MGSIENKLWALIQGFPYTWKRGSPIARSARRLVRDPVWSAIEEQVLDKIEAKIYANSRRILSVRE